MRSGRKTNWSIPPSERNKTTNLSDINKIDAIMWETHCILCVNDEV